MQKVRICGLVAVQWAAVIVALGGMVTGTPAAYACSSGVNIEGNGGNWFVGGYQIPASFPDSVRTDMTAYNPSPVYTFSGIWLGLEKSSTGQFAQLGWTHTNGNYNEYVFIQYTDNSGYVSPLYQENAPGYNPEYFEVDYVYNNGGFQFCWSEACTTYNSQNCQDQGGGCRGLTWVPNELANYGEIQDYTYQSGGNSWGSHAAGQFSLTVSSSPVEWFHSGSGNYANLTYSSNPHADYQALSHSSGYSWYTYDSRC